MKTAFDVVKPSVVSRILTLTGVHGAFVAQFGFDSIWPSQTVSRFPFCVQFDRPEPLSCFEPWTHQFLHFYEGDMMCCFFPFGLRFSVPLWPPVCFFRGMRHTLT